jgi:ADP-ribosyltransferase exoenzyme
MSTELFGSLDAEKRRIGERVAARLLNDRLPDLVKVGPEGYIHGWVCIRPPCGAVGDKVTHPEHGEGKISRVEQNGALHAKFKDGHEGILSDDGSHIFVGHGRAELSRQLADFVDFRRQEMDELYQSIATHGKFKFLDDFGEKFTATRAGKAPLDDDDIYIDKDPSDSPAVSPAVSPRMLSKEMPDDKPAKLVYSDKPVKAFAPGKIPATEAEAARDYLQNGDIVNAFLRTGKNESWDGTTDEDLRTQARELDKVISRGKLANAAVVYRGVLMTPELEVLLDKKNSLFSDLGFISATTDPRVARSYALGKLGPAAQADRSGEPLVMRIKMPAGSSVMKGDPESKEVVFPRGMKFKIMRSKNQHVITLTPVS